MKKKTGPKPILGVLLKKIAPRIGAKVFLEPEWGIAGQIVFKNGRKRYFRYSTLDVNPVGSSEIAKDKDYAKFFMRRMGYPVAEGQTFFSSAFARVIGSRRDMRAGLSYAQKIGFPVMVKPNSGSQGGGVSKVYNRKECRAAMKAVFARDRVALIERVADGRDYRIVVLGSKVISAYERLPLHVIGDGHSTIKKLLLMKSAHFRNTGRDTRIRMDDARFRQTLAHQHLTMRSVPEPGVAVHLLPNANLSTGGDPVDVTQSIHPRFKRLAIRLTKDMGLTLCGVDLMVCGEIENPPRVYTVLEINAAPGLDHYVASGKNQERIVEAMYLEVLRALER